MSSVGVLYIIGSFQFGGWERQLLEIVRRLDRARFYPIVAVLHRNGVLEAAFEETGVPIHTVGIRKLLLPDSLWRLRALARFAEAHGARVVHGFNLHANFYGAFICSPRSGRVLIASEGGIYVDLPAWQQWARRFVHRRSTRMLVNSMAVQRYVEEIPDPRPDWLRLIWNGVDTAWFDPSVTTPIDRHALGLANGDVLVGHIGRFREEKGQVFLLQALRLVAARRPGARFLVVGGGTDRPNVEREAAAAQLAGRISVLDFQEDVRPYLAAMDIFVLPSRSEGMPNALMEAMSMQRACIATRVGGTRELCDDGRAGVLVDYGDREALADRIIELVDDREERRRLALAARTRMIDLFSMERWMEDYQNLYDEALRAANRRNT